MPHASGKINSRAVAFYRTPVFRAGALAALVMCLAGHAGAADIRKSITWFNIGGTTADDLDRELSRRGPLTRNTGARHPGATEIKFGGDITYVEKEGRCSTGPVTVKLTTRLILPRWTNRKRADSELGMIWDTLSADIKRHEERHAEIARNHARDLEKRLRALRPQKDCRSLEALVSATTREVMDSHDREQLHFDQVEARNFDDRMMRLLNYRMKRNGSGR